MKHNVPPKIVEALDELLDYLGDDPIDYLGDDPMKRYRKQAKALDHWLGSIMREKRNHAIELEAQKQSQ